MNQMVLLGPQTETVKYINKPNLQVFEGSDSATEKLSDYQPPNHRKKHQQKKINGAMFEPKSRKSKVVVIETLDQGTNHREIKNHVVDKHKKGKSADIDEFKSNSKECMKKNNNQYYFLPIDKNREIFSADLLFGVRQRSSITEMKQYNHKKSTTKKNVEELGKQVGSISLGVNKKYSKKDAKPSKQGKRKQLSSKNSNKSQHSSNSRALINKQNRPKSKSNQLYTQRKITKNKQPHGNSQMKFISQTMPLTSKMVNLYSSTASLLSSNSECQVYGRGQSFVIPTQQSIEQIVQIRKYESLSLRKRSFENLRKISLISQLNDVEVPQQSTNNIINQYIHLYELQYQRQIMNSDIQLSQIPHHSSLRQRNSDLNTENLAISLEILKSREETGRQSEKNHLKEEIAEHQQQISKLNQIINIINEKKQSEGVKKEEVMKHLKFFFQQNHEKTQSNKKPQEQLKELQSKQLLSIEIPAENKNQLSWSDLKQSGTFEQSMEGLNLQILDQTLKQRQKYLQKRKQRQLEVIQQQIPIKGNEWGLKQRQRVEKWMDHQIKEVARTRKQLWKGIAIAKNLLSTQNSLQDGKKQEMIKCLSDKYLAKSKKRQNRKKSTETLAKGRVSQKSSTNNVASEKKKLQKQVQQKNQESDSQNHELSSKNSEVQIQLSHEDYDEQVDEQVVNYSSKFKNEFQEYRKKFEDSRQKINEKECLLMEPPTIGSFPLSSPGLNLQKIECELQDEESVNSDEMEALAKESQKAKQNSLRLPYDLTPEDKQDIFQFLFLDLCIELSEQYNTESSLMKKINNFIQKMKQQAKKQKGFKTNTNSIRDYLFQFITHLKNSPQLLQQVHINLQKPLGPTAADILRYMHVTDDEDPPEEQGSETVFILDIKLFENFEQTYLNTLEFEKYYDDQQKEKKRRIFLKNAIHIHNKSVFDSLNQTLDRQRPYGVWGEPFSWKIAAKFHHPRDITTKNNIILKCAQKTIENGAYMCGFMVDKQQSTLKNNPNVTQAYIQQIRDDRLSRLLANQLDQSEEKMLFIDDQETQILVEVAHFIFQSLLYEVCSFM